MESVLLTDAQRAEFEQNGFFVIENVLSQAEIDRYLTVVDRLDARITTTIKGGTRGPGDPLEVRNAIAHEPDLLELITHDRTFGYMVDLMDYNICITTTHVFLRPPSPPNTTREYKAIGWHHDGPGKWVPPVNGRLPWLYTKIGYFLTDLTTPDSGALRVVPGSHRTSGRPAWREGDPDPYGAIELNVKAGTAVVFDNRLWHAVGPNYADYARKNIYIGYCWRWMRPIDYIQQPSELLERCNPIQRQLLGDAKTSLSFILPRPEDVPLQAWAEQQRTAKQG